MSTIHHQRRGVATLEFTLSLPLLLAIFVVIVWLGFSVAGQSGVAVEARHKAWEKRSKPEGTALLFLKDDIVREKAEGKVEVSPLLDGLPQPESSHSVMIGSWDHRKLKMDKAPNWTEYAKAAANAKTGSAQIAYTDARNDFNQWKQLSQNAWGTLGQQFLSELTNLDNLFGSNADKAKSDTADTAKERQKLNRQIAAKQRELDSAKQRLRELQSSDDDSKARIKIQRNKIKRLQNDLRELKSDLNDLE